MHRQSGFKLWGVHVRNFFVKIDKEINRQHISETESFEGF